MLHTINTVSLQASIPWNIVRGCIPAGVFPSSALLLELEELVLVNEQVVARLGSEAGDGVRVDAW